jgi:hypothetical protein
MWIKFTKSKLFRDRSLCQEWLKLSGNLQRRAQKWQNHVSTSSVGLYYKPKKKWEPAMPPSVHRSVIKLSLPYVTTSVQYLHHKALCLRIPCPCQKMATVSLLETLCHVLESTLALWCGSMAVSLNWTPCWIQETAIMHSTNSEQACIIAVQSLVTMWHKYHKPS